MPRNAPLGLEQSLFSLGTFRSYTHPVNEIEQAARRTSATTQDRLLHQYLHPIRGEADAAE